MSEEEFDAEMDVIVDACPGCTPIARHFGTCSCEIRMDILRRNYERQAAPPADTGETR